MRYDFAPLEGLTDSIYRRLHHKHFGGVDRYFTPFFSPTVHRALTPREARELPPADSLDFTVVPQLLTKVPEDFLWMAGVCRDRDYKEVNLNIGCPSGTVTAKGKGSGMLRDLGNLDRFLDAVFASVPLPVSIKTRIGFESAEEFTNILTIYNRYPLKELIIHPRVRQDFYNGPVDLDSFRYTLEESKAPVCYNGSLRTKHEISAFAAEFSSVGSIMLGRGLIADPGLLSPGGTNADKLEGFHEELLEEYTREFGGTRNAMFRLKENWHYWLCKFDGSEKLGKRLRKATDVAEYKTVTQEIIHNLPMRDAIIPDWD